MNDRSVTHRNAPLDVLRFIAIVLVMGRHFAFRPPLEPRPIFLAAAYWQWGGWVGVDIFFVLSGYLIANLLFHEHQKYGRLNIKRFLIRRGFKIYPVFWLFMLTTLLVQLCYGLPIQGLKFLQELLLIHNYSSGMWHHTWSLAIETHFYLGLSGLLAWLSFRHRDNPAQAFRCIPIVFIAIAIFCLVARVYITAIKAYNPYTHLFETHLRLDALMFGVLLAWLWNYHQLATWVKRRAMRWRLMAVGIVVLSPVFIYEIDTFPWIRTYGLVLFYLGAGAIIVASLQSSILSHRYFKPVAMLGTYSYSIYLWHMPVNLWGLDLMDWILGYRMNWFAYFVFYFVTSFGLGIATTKLIEAPMLRWRDRLFPSRIAQAQSQPELELTR